MSAAPSRSASDELDAQHRERQPVAAVAGQPPLDRRGPRRDARAGEVARVLDRRAARRRAARAAAAPSAGASPRRERVVGSGRARGEPRSRAAGSASGSAAFARRARAASRSCSGDRRPDVRRARPREARASTSGSAACASGSGAGVGGRRRRLGGRRARAAARRRAGRGRPAAWGPAGAALERGGGERRDDGAEAVGEVGDLRRVRALGAVAAAPTRSRRAAPRARSTASSGDGAAARCPAPGGQRRERPAGLEVVERGVGGQRRGRPPRTGAGRRRRTRGPGSRRRALQRRDGDELDEPRLGDGSRAVERRGIGDGPRAAPAEGGGGHARSSYRTDRTRRGPACADIASAWRPCSPSTRPARPCSSRPARSPPRTCPSPQRRSAACSPRTSSPPATCRRSPTARWTASSSPRAPRAAACAIVGESRAGAPADGGARRGRGAADLHRRGRAAGRRRPACSRSSRGRPRRTAGDHPAGDAPPGQHVRGAGEDVAGGRPGPRARDARSAPPRSASPSSPAARAVTCARRPRVAVLATGDELSAARRAARAGPDPRLQRRSRSPRSPASAGARGRRARPRARRPAARARRRSPPRSSAADVLVVSGGVSVGPHDHVKPALDGARRRGALLARRAAPGQADVVRHPRRHARLRAARQPGLARWSPSSSSPARAGRAPGRRARRARASARALAEAVPRTPGARRGGPRAAHRRRRRPQRHADRPAGLAPAHLDARRRRPGDRAPPATASSPAGERRRRSSCCGASARVEVARSRGWSARSAPAPASSIASGRSAQQLLELGAVGRVAWPTSRAATSAGAAHRARVRRSRSPRSAAEVVGDRPPGAGAPTPSRHAA